MGLFCIFDKRDKEIYFEGDPSETEYEFGDPNILRIKEANPTWEIKTDDWGYIYRVFEKAIFNSRTLWREYNVFVLIVITVGITGILWIILSIVNIIKYAKMRWNLSEYVIFSSS